MKFFRKNPGGVSQQSEGLRVSALPWKTMNLLNLKNFYNAFFARPEGVPPSITPGASRGTAASKNAKPRRGVTTLVRRSARLVTPLAGLFHTLLHYPPAYAGGYRWSRPVQGAFAANHGPHNKKSFVSIRGSKHLEGKQ